MDLFAYYEAQILAVVEKLKAENQLPADIEVRGLSVEPPKDKKHGDVATNVAMILAKQAKMKPRDLAEQIVEQLQDNDFIEQINIAGPGFINLSLKKEFWYKIGQIILEQGADYGRSELGQGQDVNVEYVSANPTGPMHVGHCRGAVFGDALSNLLEFADFKVTREYYINDAGAQVDVLAKSAYLRYQQALGKEIGSIPEGLYPGDYLVPVGEKIAAEYGQELVNKTEAEWLPIVRDIAIQANMDLIKADLAALNISHDVFFSEKSLSYINNENKVTKTIDWLKEQGLVYEGRLPPPKGKLPDDWEDREQTLFKATEFGDDIDRALIKSDGSYTYFAADMAYHRNKFERGFTSMINVWGADHAGYIKRMKSAIKALTANQAELDVKICQLVNLLRDGKPVKMGKRSGNFVTLREVVDEVGADSVRFMMLFRKNDAVLDFDFDKVLDESKDNPVFYVQYAHARIYSVFRNASEIFEDLSPEMIKSINPDLQLIDTSEEINILKRLSEFPRHVESAALHHEPHRIAFYLYDLASDFHGLWNQGKESPQLRFINNTSRKLTEARLALILNVATVIASGLAILGVKPKFEMR